jgi:hypothetical protein
VRGDADDLADGDDARAADAGDEDAVRRLQLRKRGIRKLRKIVDSFRRGLAFLQPAALDRDEARQKPSGRNSPVARGLVDGALAAELGPRTPTRRQLDLTLQSPQPRTTSLITAHRGVRIRSLAPAAPRAQVWS